MLYIFNYGNKVIQIDIKHINNSINGYKYINDY